MELSDKLLAGRKLVVIEDDPREVANLREEFPDDSYIHLTEAQDWSILRESRELPEVVMVDCMMPENNVTSIVEPFGIAIVIECITLQISRVAIVSKDPHDSNRVPAYLRGLFRRREMETCHTCRCVITQIGNTKFLTAFEAVKNPGPNRVKAWAHVLEHLTK